MNDATPQAVPVPPQAGPPDTAPSATSETPLLDRQQMFRLARQPRRTERVSIPEWGGAVLVQQMTALERGRYEAYFRSKSGEAHLDRLARARHKLIVMTVVDESGTRLFTDDDMPAMDCWPASVAERLSQAAQQLSGVSDEDLGELAGNSGGTDG